MTHFTVTTSRDDWDTSFTVGQYDSLAEAQDVARGHEFHHDVESRVTERSFLPCGAIVTVPHYDY